MKSIIIFMTKEQRKMCANMNATYGAQAKQMTEEEKNMVWDVIKMLKAKPCEDVVSRERLLSGIDDLMQSPWFNYGKDEETWTHYGWVERKEAVEVVRDLCVKAEPSVFRWIPIKEDPFSELPKDRRVWVTKEDNYGHRYVSDVAWDLKRFDDEVTNVVAYMDYYEPTPYKEGEE